MQAFSTILLEDYASHLDDTAQNYARRIVRSAEAMDLLVLNLLAYGRVARSEIALDAVSVEAAWASALSQHEHAIAGSNARVEAASPLPLVRAHEATLTQVLANLLDNALKFVGPEVTPHIRLWAEEGPDRIRLWLQDNGIGIAPEHHERVFRVFERLHGKEYRGSGVGLSIVRKGIERMGGQVGLESRPGQGTRFWIDLPKP
jgi:signal transduction histidine kinase